MQAAVKCWAVLVDCRVACSSLQSGKTGSVRVVDVPGHPRVRSRFEQYADRACGVVFVVDAVDFLPHKTEVAEQLYEARSHALVVRLEQHIALPLTAHCCACPTRHASPPDSVAAPL